LIRRLSIVFNIVNQSMFKFDSRSISTSIAWSNSSGSWASSNACSWTNLNGIVELCCAVLFHADGYRLAIRQWLDRFLRTSFRLGRIQ
jgi:hypothetical protein